MFSDFGYALTSFGYLGLIFLLLITGVKGGVVKAMLLLCASFTLVWSALHISYFGWIQTIESILWLDSIKLFVFVLFALSCLKHKEQDYSSFFLKPISLFFILASLFTVGLNGISSVNTLWIYFAMMVVSLSLLVLMEMLFRQSGEQKWAFKPLVFYFGALALFDFVTYANASMVSQLGINYIHARGYLYLVTLPFLVLAIRRISDWGVSIYVSRDIVLHSSMLMVAGAYLFLMAIVGYAVKFFGGNWSNSVQLALMAVSVVLLATIFLSEHFRTKLKVFIAKHFFANQFDYRIEWVKLTEKLSENANSKNEMFDIALSGFIDALEFKYGALYKLFKSDFHEVSEQNAPEFIRSLSYAEKQSLIHFLQSQRWIIDLTELLSTPEHYEGLDIKGIDNYPAKGAHIILPIFNDNNLWGIVSLATDSVKKFTLNWEVRDYLNAVTAQISSYILQREIAEALAENAQFAAFNRMSAFVLHDLKNVKAQVELILTNAQQHKHNPEFIDDTFETLEYTNMRISKMLNQLSDKNLVEQTKESEIDLILLLSNVIDSRCKVRNPIPKLVGPKTLHVSLDAEKISNVMYHLISNAQQATDDNGSVEVCIGAFDDVGSESSYIQILIKDTGSGMSESFISERLFKPFDTTKGNAGMGIGAYDAKHYIEEIGGALTVKSEIDVGTVFDIKLPVNIERK